MKKKLILNKTIIKELDNSELDSLLGGIYGISDPDNTGHTMKQNTCQPPPRRPFTVGNCFQTIGDDTCWTTWLCKVGWPGMVSGNLDDGFGEGESQSSDIPYFLLPENAQIIEQDNKFNEFLETIPTIITAKGGGGGA